MLPYLTNVDSEFETLVDMTQTAYNAIEKKGSAWIDEVIDGEDPVDVVTGGKMTTVGIQLSVNEKRLYLMSAQFSFKT